MLYLEYESWTSAISLGGQIHLARSSLSIYVIASRLRLRIYSRARGIINFTNDPKGPKASYARVENVVIEPRLLSQKVPLSSAQRFT